MPNRGNRRGGRGGRGENFKTTSSSSRNHETTTSIHSRLGRIAVYGPKGSVDPRTASGKYKFVKPSTIITSSIAAIPGEQKIRVLAKKFLKSYYEIFDQPGRPNLETQYNNDAFFSFSATHPLSSIQPFGRNLLQVLDHGQRISLLFHDKTNISRFLATFIPTEHMVNYLATDVPYYIVNPMSVITMQIIVNGVFKDTSETTNPLRAFTRVFVLKQMSTDKQGEPIYEIFNDLFMIQPPTPDQIKRYHHDLQIANRLSQNRPNTSSTISNTIGDSHRTQEKMVQSIMSKTKMNASGSRKLLEDTDWNEDKALETFKNFDAAGMIPQDYYI